MELWGIAWRNLLATILDYGFRVYGQLDTFMNHKEWARKHSAVLKSIANVELDIQVDRRGRLIVIDSSGSDSQQDLDGDDFQETICFSHEEAISILSRSDADVTNKVNEILGDWQLKPEQREDDIIDEPLPVNILGAEAATDGSTVVTAGSVAEVRELDPVSPLPVDTEVSESLRVDNEHDPVLVESMGENLAENGIKFEVGNTINQFSPEELYFYPGNTALTQLNVGVVGDLGTGITQLISGANTSACCKT